MRYFLLDKVTGFTLGERATGIKCVTLSDEVLHDHFPDHPVFPGALIVEAMSQLAGFLLEMSVNRPGKPVLRALLVQIDKAKFHATCGPGDQILLEATVHALADNAAQMDVTAHVGGARAARARLTFALRAIDSERVHAQRRYLYELWTRDLQIETPIL